MVTNLLPSRELHLHGRHSRHYSESRKPNEIRQNPCIVLAAIIAPGGQNRRRHGRSQRQRLQLQSLASTPRSSTVGDRRYRFAVAAATATTARSLMHRKRLTIHAGKRRPHSSTAATRNRCAI